MAVFDEDEAIKNPDRTFEHPNHLLAAKLSPELKARILRAWKDQLTQFLRASEESMTTPDSDATTAAKLQQVEIALTSVEGAAEASPPER